MAAARGLRPKGGCGWVAASQWGGGAGRSQWGGGAGAANGEVARAERREPQRGCGIPAMSDSRAQDAASDLGSGSRRRTWTELLGKRAPGPGWVVPGPETPSRPSLLAGLVPDPSLPSKTSRLPPPLPNPGPSPPDPWPRGSPVPSALGGGGWPPSSRTSRKMVVRGGECKICPRRPGARGDSLAPKPQNLREQESTPRSVAFARYC